MLYVHGHEYESQRLILVFCSVYQSVLYNLRQGLSLNWLPANSSNSLVIVPHITKLTALSDHAWLFIWVLGNQTQVRMLLH